MTAIRKQKTAIRKQKTATAAPKKARKPCLSVVPFDWAGFWAQRPDLPVVSVWQAVAPVSRGTCTASVVAGCYKEKYGANGTKGRGNGDKLWELCLRFLDLEGKLDVPAFEAFLDENGVKHAAWKRSGNGWEGRLRMSGSVMLRAKLRRGEAVLLGGVAVL